MLPVIPRQLFQQRNQMHRNETHYQMLHFDQLDLRTPSQISNLWLKIAATPVIQSIQSTTVPRTPCFLFPETFACTLCGTRKPNFDSRKYAPSLAITSEGSVWLAFKKYSAASVLRAWYLQPWSALVIIRAVAFSHFPIFLVYRSSAKRSWC